jgi:hypothetical protein
MQQLQKHTDGARNREDAQRNMMIGGGQRSIDHSQSQLTIEMHVVSPIGIEKAPRGALGFTWISWPPGASTRL